MKKGGGTYGFAQLASNTSLLTTRVTSQSVLSTEPRRDWSLLERVVNRISAPQTISIRTLTQSRLHLRPQWHPRSFNLRRSEKLLQHHVHAPRHLGEQEELTRLIHGRGLALVPSLRASESEFRRRRAGGGSVAGWGG